MCILRLCSSNSSFLVTQQIRMRAVQLSVTQQIRMRAVQLRIKRLSLRRPESVFLVSVTVPTATKYSEPCHSWSVLDCPLSCFLGVPPPDADHNLPVGSHNTTNLFSFEMSPIKTLFRGPPISNTSTRDTYKVSSFELNDLTAVPLMADSRKREKQSCSQLRPNLSYSSIS